MVPDHWVLGTCWHGHPCSCRVGLAHNGSRIDVAEVREQQGGQETLCIEVCKLYGVGGTTQLPIGGWCILFSMGGVKSGWLSKIQDLNCSR